MSDDRLRQWLEDYAKRPKMIRHAIRCRKCGDVIESTYRHDFKWCSCGTCGVDGGVEMPRTIGERTDWEDLSEWEPSQ